MIGDESIRDVDQQQAHLAGGNQQDDSNHAGCDHDEAPLHHFVVYLPAMAVARRAQEHERQREQPHCSEVNIDDEAQRLVAASRADVREVLRFGEYGA